MTGNAKIPKVRVRSVLGTERIYLFFSFFCSMTFSFLLYLAVYARDAHRTTIWFACEMFAFIFRL